MIEAIDLTKLMPAGLKAFPQAVMAVIPAMADITRNEIIRLAGERLTSSSQLYAAAVQVPKFHFPSGKIPDGLQTVASITLIDWLPNAIEKGWSGMDLKPALLDGRNAKDMKGGGRYNIVPFRHGSPGTSGRNFAPMGSQHVKAGKMAADTGAAMAASIHAKAKKLTGTTGSPGKGNVTYGEKLDHTRQHPLKPHHKTDLHSGMIRKTKRGKTAGFMTFRTVSSNSDTAAFVHPGIEGAHLFQEGADYLAKRAGYLLQQALDGATR